MIWKDIDDYFTFYQISDTGQVRNNRSSGNGKGRILRPIEKKDGKLYILLNLWGNQKLKPIDRLVLETFVGKRKPKTRIIHLDGNLKNNSLQNVRWKNELWPWDVQKIKE